MERGRVMQIYPRDHAEVHPQKKKEVLSLVKKKQKQQRQKKKTKKKTRTTEHYDINCEVLLQEFNKHPLFIYNNSMF